MIVRTTYVHFRHSFLIPYIRKTGLRKKGRHYRTSANRLMHIHICQYTCGGMRVCWLAFFLMYSCGDDVKLPYDGLSYNDDSHYKLSQHLAYSCVTNDELQVLLFNASQLQIAYPDVHIYMYVCIYIWHFNACYFLCCVLVVERGEYSMNNFRWLLFTAAFFLGTLIFVFAIYVCMRVLVVCHECAFA